MSKPGYATVPAKMTRTVLRDSARPRSALSFPAPVARAPGSELVSTFVPLSLRPSLPPFLFGLVLVVAGCTLPSGGMLSSGWLADYDTAEQRVSDSNRELLIFFADTRPGADKSMERALKSDPVKTETKNAVCCMLVKAYEPDRRYVAQYGVDRAPALILVHSDGTYHARSGSMSGEEIMEFLATAQPPGTAPKLNRYVPRRPRYSWLHSIEEAETAAERTSQPMLIVFYRKLSRDWQRLHKLLARHEVYLRLADMVHCRIGVLRFLDDTAETRFGPMRLPALVIAPGDGTHHVLELPTSCKSVALFADKALRDVGLAQTN